MVRARFDPSAFQTVYVDESSQTKHRYLVLGSLILNTEHEGALAAELLTARLPQLPSGELGWTKVSRTKLEAYRRVVDAFFDNPSGYAPLEFHALVLDTRQFKDALYNSGSREIGFNKEVFQICKKAARLHPRRLLHVYLDSRNTKSSTEELRLILNRDRARSGDRRPWPFRRLHFRSSADCQIMQLLDVLLGGLAYRLNGHDLAEAASPAKRELSSHILARAGVRDAMRDTAMSGKFTIWYRQLR
ncbi:DUF3800 domain-containing protein [Brevundimonas sp.]|jgi:hypothetical protein|uniref:DUF3800 domain-containing protein n=1 Tax=Brevundimonas sp. TaxID=1871086 RepID=UPI002E122CD0